MGETNIPDPTIPLKQSMIAAILPMPLSSCKFPPFLFFSIFYRDFFIWFSSVVSILNLFWDWIKSVSLWGTAISGQIVIFSKISKFSCRFWHTDFTYKVYRKPHLTIVLMEGARFTIVLNNVNSKVESDILRLKQREKVYLLTESAP